MNVPAPAYKGDGAYVFVCYAHEERSLVYPEIVWLQEQGVNVWYDEGISPGHEWSEELGQAINNADRLLFFVTPTAAGSRHCRNEVHYAQNHDTPIIAVHLRETRLPAGLELSLGPSQAILAYDSRATYRSKLLRALGTPTTNTDPHDERKPAFRRTAVATVIVVLVLAAGVAGWWIVVDESESGPRIAQVDSLAVLPFDGIGLSQETEWLTDGIPGELTELLASVPRLQIASRSSAFALHHTGESPESIGAKLGVDAVLVGALQALGEEFEVDVEMIQQGSAAVLWRQTFVGSQDDLRELQTRLAGQIFNYFGAQLSPYNVSRPQSPEAYEAHVRRAAAWLTGDPAAQLKWAEMTTTLEPDFAMGYVNLITPYIFAGIEDPRGPWREKIRSALDAADRLGISDSPQFMAHEGYYQWVYGQNLDGGERLLRQAFLEDDQYGRAFYARLLAASGLSDSVLGLFEKLTLTEPYVGLHWEILGERRAYAGDYSGGVAAYSKAMELAPEDPFLYETRSVMYAMAGQTDLAQQDFDRLRRATGFYDFRIKAAEATVRYWQGDETFAREVAEELAQSDRHLYAAGLYLLLGDPRAQGEYQAAAAAPTWTKYWAGRSGWRIPERLRQSKTHRDFADALGYTDAWRLELCQRVSRLPPQSGLGCDPARYADE